MKDTIKSLCFTYQQKGKLPEKGVLTATAICGCKKTILLIDSFTLSGEPRRNRFVRKLYEGERMLDECSFPKATLTQCLLEMAADTLAGNKPPVEKDKSQTQPDEPLKGLAFEQMLANHTSPPPCYIERTIQRNT